jgi:single-strand DNA-binding protein
MIDLNKVFLAGNLTRDPEIRHTPSGSTVAELGLAVNTGWGEKKETAFIDVTAWGKSAEFCGAYLKKGSAVLVEGRLRQETWQDKQTGQKRSKIGVVAERIQFADSRRDGEKVEEASAERPQGERRSEAAGDEDLPF